MINEIGFYSLAAKQLNKIKYKINDNNQLLNYLKNNGVCLDELIWAGILNSNYELINEFKSINLWENKNNIINLLNNEVSKVKEIVDFKFHLFPQYVIKDSSNFRNVIIYYDVQRPTEYHYFYGLHYRNPKDIFFVLRYFDRQINNNKCLHLEDLQSEWSPFGKKDNFSKTNEEINLAIEKIEQIKCERNKDNYNEMTNKLFKEIASIKNKVPSGPYVMKVRHWVDLGIRRFIMSAVNENYDSLAITMGETHKHRYSSIGRLKILYSDIIIKRFKYILNKIDPSIKFEIIEFSENESIIHAVVTDKIRKYVKNGFPTVSSRGFL